MEDNNLQETYVTFSLGNEIFAVNVFQVQEILELVNITPVPESSPFMKGIINLRGNVLPVIDTRLKFGMPEKDYTSRTRIIVITLLQEDQVQLMGLVVDAVSSVVEIPGEAITPPVSFNDMKRAAYISGIARMEQGFVMILDIAREAGLFAWINKPYNAQIFLSTIERALTHGRVSV